MKYIAGLLAVAALLPSRTLVGAEPQPACTFNINSSGSLSHYLGQSEDGTIQLSGTTSSPPFSIDPQGGVRDSRGFGCVVTEPPNAQIGCYQNREPDSDLSLNALHQLLYRDSAQFWACPATESTYSVHVEPNSERADCVAVELTASGCVLPEDSACALPLSTWQTHTVTTEAVQTVTVVVTETRSGCELPTDDIAESGLPPGPRDVQSAPHHRSKRADDLDALWREVKGNAYHGDRGSDYWVKTNRHRIIRLTPGRSIRIGTDFFYGCTVWVVVGPRAVLFGHAPEEDGNRRPFESYDTTFDIMIDNIEKDLDGASAEEAAANDCDRHAWIMGSVPDQPGRGPEAMRDWLEFEGVSERQIRYLNYGGGAVLDPNNPPAGPRGKGVVTVDAAADGTAVLKVFLSSEQPRMTLNLQTVDGENGQVYAMLPEMTTSTSSSTT